MKYCSLIRSMTSKEGAHDRATYEMHTGYKPLASIGHPSLGSLVVQQKGKKNPEIPAYVSVGQASFGAGFLGSQYAPFYIGDINHPDRNIEFPPGVDDARFKRRVDMLKEVDREFNHQDRDNTVKEYAAYYRDAIKMMYSNSVEAFSLTGGKTPEKPETIKAYGENGFGRSVLTARRLVERGVRFVECSMGGWDNHQKCFDAVEKNLNTLDPALGNLIEDLNARACCSARWCSVPANSAARQRSTATTAATTTRAASRHSSPAAASSRASSTEKATRPARNQRKIPHQSATCTQQSSKPSASITPKKPDRAGPPDTRRGQGKALKDLLA